MTKLTGTIEFSSDFIEQVADAALSAPMWIDEVQVLGEWRGECASEHIANGGTIRIHDCEADKRHTITADEFAQATAKYIQMLYVDEALSGCYLDDATAEIVFQLAAFGEVIYG